MKKYYSKHLSISIILIILLFSCNKKFTSNVNRNIQSKKLDFNYFKTKAKLKYAANGESISASMNLRINDSELIWISISKFGKEAMRAKLMPDSTHLMNKYPVKDRYYQVFPTQEYLNKAGLDLDFTSVQNLIFGRHPIPLNKKDQVKVTEENISIVQNRHDVIIETVLDSQNSLLKTAKIISKQDTLTLKYEKYITVDKHLIPTTFKFRISKMEESTRQISNAEVNFTSPKFDIDKPSFSFKVPNSYERR